MDIIIISLGPVLLLFQYRTDTLTKYYLTYRETKSCCSGYGPIPNCLRKIFVVNVHKTDLLLYYI